MEILLYPNKHLRTIVTPCKRITKHTRDIIEEMKDTLQRVIGLGLAAPQIGYDKAIFVAWIRGIWEEAILTAFINPEIVSISSANETSFEECLSLPEAICAVTRSSEVFLGYQDEGGFPTFVRATGQDGRVIQHEMDHLKGKLIIDYEDPRKVD